LPVNKPIETTSNAGQTRPDAAPPGDNPSEGPAPPQDTGATGAAQPHSGPGSGAATAALLVLIVASGLRFWALGRESLWYDEVVPMRLALMDTTLDLLRVLPTHDATAAPAHPLLLQAWLRVAPRSEAFARGLSAGLGVLTVGLVGSLAGRLYDRRTALWASWLTAVSPLMVQYSREVRMYSLLTCLTVIAWRSLLGLGRRSRWFGLDYAVWLALLVYTHPLGILMVAALGSASLVERRRLGLGLARWASWHALALALAVPVLPNYLNHEPSIESARWLAIRYVLGLPIGFVGGNFVVLAGCVALIAWGAVCRGRYRPGMASDGGASLSILLIWLIVPPALLYAYSLASHPIFGQARYTLFVGPAYLILLARGLAKLPGAAAFAVAAGLAICSGVLLWQTVYSPGLKADWRTAARIIAHEDPAGATILVYPADPRWAREFEVARYYLGAHGWSYRVGVGASPPGAPTGPIWLAVGLRNGRPVARLPERAGRTIDLEGLRLVRLRTRTGGPPGR
jgi:hypothetical protein